MRINGTCITWVKGEKYEKYGGGLYALGERQRRKYVYFVRYTVAEIEIANKIIKISLLIIKIEYNRNI